MISELTELDDEEDTNMDDEIQKLREEISDALDDSFDDLFDDGDLITEFVSETSSYNYVAEHMNVILGEYRKKHKNAWVGEWNVIPLPNNYVLIVMKMCCIKK